MAVLTPHFDLPFRLAGSSFAVVDQDSPADIANCVEAILRTPFGDIVDTPDFGLDDHTFDMQPIDTDSIRTQVLNQEPRAALLLEQDVNKLDNLIDEITVTVG